MVTRNCVISDLSLSVTKLFHIRYNRTRFYKEYTPVNESYHLYFSTAGGSDKHLKIWYILLHFPSPAASKKLALGYDCSVLLLQKLLRFDNNIRISFGQGWIASKI
jgi:hypothetical protein